MGMLYTVIHTKANHQKKGRNQEKKGHEQKETVWHKQTNNGILLAVYQNIVKKHDYFFFQESSPKHGESAGAKQGLNAS